MNKQDILQYCEQYYPEKSITNIAQNFHINRHYLSKLLKENGFEIISHRRKYTLNEDFFSDIDTEEKAYWLGFIAADGSVSKSTLRINLNIRDKNHLFKFIKAIKSNTIIKDIPGTGFGEGTTLSRVDINSAKMISDLNKHGIVPRKSLILKPPVIDLELNKHWIRGYLDGDGTIIPKLSNGNAQLSFIGTLEVLKWIEKELIGTNTHALYRKKESISNNYQLSFGGTKTILKYINYLYDNAIVYLDRKYEKVQELKSRFEK